MLLQPINVYAPATVSVGLGSMVGATLPTYAVDSGPWLIGGKLYLLGQLIGVSANPQRILVMRSVDGGNNWSILDQANSPIKNTGAFTDAGQQAGSFRLGNTLTVAYAPANIGGPTAGIVRLRDFDFVTETWGVDYAAGGPSAENVMQAVRRSDGTIVVFHWHGTTSNDVRFSVWNGAVWNSNNVITSNITAGYHSNGSTAVVLDAVDTIHVIGLGLLAANPNIYWYQQILSNNALGNFNNLTGTFNITNLTNQNPVIWNGCLVFGVTDLTNTMPLVLIGTGLINPVWTLSGNIDPTSDFFFAIPFSFMNDGTNLWAAAVGENAGPTMGLLRVLKTTNANPALGWALVGETTITTPSAANQQWARMSPSSLAFPYIVFEDAAPVGGPGQPTLYFTTDDGGGLPGQPLVNANAFPVIVLPNPAKDCR